MTYMTYAGALSYEEEGAEDLVTFSLTKNLNALIQVWNIEYSALIDCCVLFIHQNYPHTRMGQNFYFRFQSSKDYIELNFDSPQEEPFTGWTIKPHTKPCRVS